jgi:hypothetical protein
MTPYLYGHYNSTSTGNIILKDSMSAVINAEKDHIKRIFRTLDLCTLSARSEEIIASLEDFYHERGYLSPKQKELLMDIYEKAES